MNATQTNINIISMVGNDYTSAIEYDDVDEVIDDFTAQVNHLALGKYAMEPETGNLVPLKFLGITRAGDIVGMMDIAISMVFTTYLDTDKGVVTCGNGIGIRQHIEPGTEGTFRAVSEHNAYIIHDEQIVAYVDLNA